MILLLFLLSLLIFPPRIYALYNPLDVPNNKFGIHLADFNDLPDVSALVNTNGGDWGYVTLVASDNDRDTSRWQALFNQMRRNHLIPIVRLATHVEGGNWVKPDKGKLKEIVAFFNNLNWPVENRYLVLYNEPNHGNEWGGAVNPEEYADDITELIADLKSASTDFFIMPAALDASAATDGNSLSADVFWRRLVSQRPEILNLIDGLPSHSYPNPGFSGSPYAFGRGTLRSFDWELSYLRQLGLTKNLPVFITETGWQHASGKNYTPGFLSDTQVGQNILAAAGHVWSEPRVVAVTPFVFNYQDEPFDHFSWKRYQDNSFYPQYADYQSLIKVKGEPKQREIFNFSPPLIPTSLVAASTYNLAAGVGNAGQSILTKNDYELTVEDERHAFSEVLIDPLPTVEPSEKGAISLHLKTSKASGIYPIAVRLKHFGRDIEILKENIILVPPPSLALTAQLGWRKTSDSPGVSVLIYDLKDKLIEKFTGLKLQNGRVEVPGLVDIVPGQKYRVVILVPYYLPRQSEKILSRTVTDIEFKRLLPLDFDNDGALTLHDLVALLQTKPTTVLSRFLGP